LNVEDPHNPHLAKDRLKKTTKNEEETRNKKKKEL